MTKLSSVWRKNRHNNFVSLDPILLSSSLTLFDDMKKKTNKRKFILLWKKIRFSLLYSHLFMSLWHKRWKNKLKGNELVTSFLDVHNMHDDGKMTCVSVTHREVA